VASPEWPAPSGQPRVASPVEPVRGEGEQGGGWVVVSRVAAQVADDVGDLDVGRLDVGDLDIGHLTVNW
jgi:hypothetical protein